MLKHAIPESARNVKRSLLQRVQEEEDEGGKLGGEDLRMDWAKLDLHQGLSYEFEMFIQGE